jgi:hypothetical protein
VRAALCRYSRLERNGSSENSYCSAGVGAHTTLARLPRPPLAAPTGSVGESHARCKACSQNPSHLVLQVLGWRVARSGRRAHHHSWQVRRCGGLRHPDVSDAVQGLEAGVPGARGQVCRALSHGPAGARPTPAPAARGTSAANQAAAPLTAGRLRQPSRLRGFALRLASCLAGLPHAHQHPRVSLRQRPPALLLLRLPGQVHHVLGRRHLDRGQLLPLAGLHRWNQAVWRPTQHGHHGGLQLQRRPASAQVLLQQPWHGQQGSGRDGQARHGASTRGWHSDKLDGGWHLPGTVCARLRRVRGSQGRRDGQHVERAAGRRRRQLRGWQPRLAAARQHIRGHHVLGVCGLLALALRPPGSSACRHVLPTAVPCCRNRALPLSCSTWTRRREAWLGLHHARACFLGGCPIASVAGSKHRGSSQRRSTRRRWHQAVGHSWVSTAQVFQPRRQPGAQRQLAQRHR